MSTTSQKHRDFVGEPMGDKPVTALSGIGDILGKKLEQQGFDKVDKTHGNTQKYTKQSRSSSLKMKTENIYTTYCSCVFRLTWCSDSSCVLFMYFSILFTYFCVFSGLRGARSVPAAEERH